MMGQGSREWGMLPPEKGATVTQGVFVYVPDVKAHFARAEAAGAVIDGPLADHGYGLTYTVRDLDGHPWFFTQMQD